MDPRMDLVEFDPNPTRPSSLGLGTQQHDRHRRRLQSHRDPLSLASHCSQLVSASMASPEDDFAGVSLFEGMVLFSPPDLSPPLPNPDNSSSQPSPTPPPPLTPPPLPPSSPPPPPVPPSPPSSPPPTSQSQSQPLDEDLFSDLTLQSQPQPDPLLLDAISTNSHQPPNRQISRKKKRAVRIGYARDSLPLDNSSSLEPEPTPIPDPQIPSESADDSKVEILPQVVEERATETTAIGSPLSPPSNEDEKEQPQQQQPPQGEEAEAEAAGDLIEDKLELERARISSKLSKIRETAVLLSAQRKELGRRRRKVMESVNSASEKYKEMERELEEACEAEDFERAENVSESLAEKEKEKDGLLSELRDAELECDAVDSKMQEVLELQIAAEEEGATLLEQFAKDADDYADSVLRRAEEISSKELEEWESSMELVEINKIEMEVESQLVSEALSGLENSIEHLVEDDRKEAEILRRKQCILSKELDELLAIVRLKEAEIAENDSQIHKVEKKNSEVISEFRETQANIDMKHDNLHLSLSKLGSESEALSIKKKEIDEFILQEQQKRSKLRELASVTLDEVKTCRDLLGLRKSLASSILKSREDKVKFAKTEETVLEEIQILRQQISAARTTLQELSSSRVSIQQEIVSYNQRIGFIDKRGPELEAEKKIAAAARNFKEAGRIAAEAKALNVEKESLETKIEKAVVDVKKLEEEIKDTVDRMQENEGLILLQEKEAAMAGCKRLRLVAGSAKAERSAALEMGDVEEGDSLLKEAEAAESKARELQETYDLEPEGDGKTLEHSVSIALIINLSGQHLAEMAASFNLSANDKRQM